ncbi:alpha/beta fold hydrolase [Candidatus Woesearchaeota archaeon]|nr:alpha/beta fold hydrolase [Candidatus Woesearchaeota archaeon]
MRLFIIILLVLFLVGCEGKIVDKEDVWLETKDSVRIISTIWYGRGDKAVILVHMLDRDRNDWEYFAKKLNVFRITAMGIDLRGHGESEGDWREFSDIDFNKMTYDIEKAKSKLEKEGKKVNVIIGASIGANLALKYAAEDQDIKAVVLLSPGIAYKSVNIEDDIESFNKPVFIAVSEEDSYPLESSNIIYEKVKGEKELFIGENLGHGTDMIPKSEELQNKIFEFLNKYS